MATNVAEPTTALHQKTIVKISDTGIYVDDLIIAWSTSDEVKSNNTFLEKSFSIKEPGKLVYCLGVKIHRDRPNDQMFLGQKAFVERLLEKSGPLIANLASHRPVWRF